MPSMPLALVAALLPLVDATPETDDVVAGPWGAVVIGALILATVLLLRSFTKHLKKVERPADEER